MAVRIDCLVLSTWNHITTSVKRIPLKKIIKMVGLFTMVYGIMEKQPLLAPNRYLLEKETLYLLMFEKVVTQHTNCTSGVAFQQLNTSNDN